MSDKLAAHCPICNRLLDSHTDRAIGVCAAPKCRGPYLQRKRLDAESQRRAWRTNYARELPSQWPELDLGEASGVDSQVEKTEPIVVTVPAFNRPITRLPEDRKKLFQDHLDAVVADAKEIIATGKRLDSLRTEFAHRSGTSLRPSPAVVINGCSTCRGYCCQHGGNTAFLTSGFLAWQMLDRQVSADSLRQQYIDKLPDESIEGSCVYHTPRGCVLSRDDRNEICNNFHCEGLMDAFDKFDLEPTVTSIAISTDGERTFRVGVMNSKDIRQEREL